MERGLLIIERKVLVVFAALTFWLSSSLAAEDVMLPASDAEVSNIFHEETDLRNLFRARCFIASSDAAVVDVFAIREVPGSICFNFCPKRLIVVLKVEGVAGNGLNSLTSNEELVLSEIDGRGVASDSFSESMLGASIESDWVLCHVEAMALEASLMLPSKNRDCRARSTRESQL